MTFEKLSKKQKMLLKWCHMPSTKDKYNAIICDGAVRSGKTVVMTTSFVLWAMHNFNESTFAICGKTVQSAERNIIQPMRSIVDITYYFHVSYTRSTHLLTIEGNGKRNYFYVFGGKDEASAALIQGLTLSGIMLDEVALMPRSFVEQAIARTLSISNAKFWFNCNPENPNHYFYKEWICKADEKKALHLHFKMNDNPILSDEDIAKAESLYTGVFYDRFIKGLWVVAEGLIYPEQARGENIVVSEERNYDSYYISCDYGTLNPCAMLLWGRCDGAWYVVKEFYYDGRQRQKQLTDEEYYHELKKLAGNCRINSVIIDPSAASFIACIRRHGKFQVVKADNAVVDGIRVTAVCFEDKLILVNDCCQNTINEFQAYRWDEKASDDKPIKEHDHAMDALRYFAKTIISKPQVKVRTRPTWL